jgi:lysophospholipase L1-like esterase
MTLEQALHALGHDAIVKHVGYSGWTSQELLTSPIGNEAQPDIAFVLQRELTTLAVILAGTNDLGRRTNATDTEIAESVWALHTVAHKLHVPTVVVSIPTTGYGMGVRNRDAWDAWRGRVNALLRDRCTAEAPMCAFADCPVAWAGADDPHWEPDAVHMSPRGYKALGRRLAPTVAGALVAAAARTRNDVDESAASRWSKSEL